MDLCSKILAALHRSKRMQKLQQAANCALLPGRYGNQSDTYYYLKFQTDMSNIRGKSSFLAADCHLEKIGMLLARWQRSSALHGRGIWSQLYANFTCDWLVLLKENTKVPLKDMLHVRYFNTAFSFSNLVRQSL